MKQERIEIEAAEYSPTYLPLQIKDEFVDELADHPNFEGTPTSIIIQAVPDGLRKHLPRFSRGDMAVSTAAERRLRATVIALLIGV